MKKLPLVFSGCLLGLAGAGNLVLDTVPVSVPSVESDRFGFVDLLSDFASL